MLTNEERAEAGHEAIKAGSPDQTDHETETTDTLVNIMHYCARHGIDFAKRLNMARLHYEAEEIEGV